MLRDAEGVTWVSATSLKAWRLSLKHAATTALDPTLKPLVAVPAEVTRPPRTALVGVDFSAFSVGAARTALESWRTTSLVKRARVMFTFAELLRENLDEIAKGRLARSEWLKRFYFGGADVSGLRSVVENLGEIDARAINSMPR